ncbi:MAG: CrcB family protein [Terracoccus sp.]
MQDPRAERDPGDGSGDNDQLPLDPDIEVDDLIEGHRPRPAHLRWGPIGLVALGGGLGTATREAVSLALPPTGPFPLAIFLVNVTGAFALGLVLEVLLRRGPDQGLGRSLRLLVGTGFMGGYTTYSTLAVGAGQSVVSGQPVVGLVYAGVSVVVGAAAAFAGVAVASELHRRRGADRGRPS